MSIDFDELKDKALDMAQTGISKAKVITGTAVEKGKQLAEIGKLKMQNASERESMRKTFIELGREYYAKHADDPEPASLSALCGKIAAIQSRINYNEERIADIKAAAGFTDQEVEEAECECGCCCEDEAEEETPTEEKPEEEKPEE